VVVLVMWALDDYATESCTFFRPCAMSNPLVPAPTIRMWRSLFPFAAIALVSTLIGD
jgi:hypothetical protein